jgi:hypothetical protein
MTPQERELLDAAVKAAVATHFYWVGVNSVCEHIFAGDPEGARVSDRTSNVGYYAEQSQDLSARVIELRDRLAGV